MKRFMALIASMACLASISAQRTIYVAPDGDDSAAGTIDAPIASVQKALDMVEPGGSVYLRGGTYYPEKRLLPPRKPTNADARITIASYPGERAVIDGSHMKPKSVNEFKQSRCLYLTYWCDYYYIKDLDFTNALDNGVKVEGSYNVFENCAFYRNNDTGLQIGLFKDWKIEEFDGFYDDSGNKITGTPEFNPAYQFCRGNKVINCDSYFNADLKAYSGTDDGGDADGFACKLFPGPGTEFYGCRAWVNSDDNWDLYMVYHPVVIDHCWAYKGGYTEAGELIGNGNGFKLGGGGTSGGAAFSQSVGAHVVRNCVAFDNGAKGFDQNNAYEGMYIINCTGWGNAYNYRFPTLFMYGGMYIRNCVGFNPTKLNHEFLSENKEGSVVPDTEYNSWTSLDGCNPYKEGQKIEGTKDKPMTKDYSGEFLSLSVADFMAPREVDGSLPDNGFARLREGSVLIDKGTPIEYFVPFRFMTEAEAKGLELITAAAFTIPYAGAAPDLGAYEYGVATAARMVVKSGATVQTVYMGTEIAPITIVWSGEISNIEVSGLTDDCGLKAVKDDDAHTLIITGMLLDDAVIKVSAIGSDDVEDIVLVLTASRVAPGTLTCTGDPVQTVMQGDAISPVVYEIGGGATGIEYSESVASGLTYTVDGGKLTISGVPSCSVSYTVTATGGMTDLQLSGTINIVPKTHTLGAFDASGWYQFQTSLADLPEDLQGRVAINFDNADEYGRQYSDVGNTSMTFWDKNWSGDSGYTSPLLSSKGACNIGSGSALEWTLPSCAALKVNMYSTGKREFMIHYMRDGIDSGWRSVSVSELGKGSYELDLLSLAAIEPCHTPISVRFECSSKGSKMLGVRIYDMYVECYGDAAPSGVDAIEVGPNVSVISTGTMVIAQGAEISSIQVFSLDGHLCAASALSGICDISSLSTGIYVVNVTTSSGETISQKIVR